MGCVLYELATGKPPFNATGLKDLIQQICESETPKVEGFSPVFNDLLARLLEKDPVKRIYWEHLRKHPFWSKEINQRQLPKQPQFDAYLSAHGINVDDFYLQQERNAFFVPNVHYRVPRKVDPVRISHTVKKNMLKENAMYEKSDHAAIEAANDVALLSKDMEINFSNKNDYDDDDDVGKMTGNDIEGAARLIKADSMDIIDDSDLKGVIQGMPIEDIKIGEKQKILLEEQKEPKGKGPGGALPKQTPGRSKLQTNTTAEPKVQVPLSKKEQTLKQAAGGATATKPGGV